MFDSKKPDWANLRRLGNKQKSGTSGVIAIAVLVLLVVLAVAVAFFLSAFIVMVVWGAIAGIFGSTLTISYGQALAVTLGLWIIGSIFGGSHTHTKKE
jgi:hypothetical protein